MIEKVLHLSGLLLAHDQSSVVGPFSSVAAAAGLLVAALRLVRGMGLHISDAMSSNRRVKSQLLADWGDIRSRIELMLQLSQSGAALLCPAGSQTLLPERLLPGVVEAGAGDGAFPARVGLRGSHASGSLFVGQDSGEVVSPGGSILSGEHVEGGAQSPGLVRESFTSDAGSCGDGRLYSLHPLAPTSMPNSPGFESRAGDRQLQSGYEMLTHDQH